jgi:RHS repeat-associated protein
VAIHVQHKLGVRARRFLSALAAIGVFLPCAVVAAPSVVARAATGDCGFTGEVTTFDGNGSAAGDWNVAANWDGDVVPPPYVQICVPVGKTARFTTGGGLGSSVAIRVQGTLRFTAGSAYLSDSYADNSLVNTGRIEVASGTSFQVGNWGGSFTNGLGGVVRVEGGGALRVNNIAFKNLGGQVDLTGGGTATVVGNGGFEQGASAGPSPVQSTVIGGRVDFISGSTLTISGTGAGTFRALSGSQVTVTGNVSASQHLELQCEGSGSPAYLAIGSDVVNDGSIALLPRVSGTCTSDLHIPDGRTLTNNGTLTVGSTASPTDGFWMSDRGSVVNTGTGVVTVNAQLYSNLGGFANEGTMTVAAGAAIGFGDTLFDLRAGTVTNNGSISNGRSSPTYAFYGTFRIGAGNLVGNALRPNPAYLEFLGSGSAAVQVDQSMYGLIRNPSGPIVIHPNQSLVLNGGSIDSAGFDVENQGTITLTGTNDYGSTFGNNSGGTVSNRGTVTSTGTGSGYNSFLMTLQNQPGGVYRSQVGRPCYGRALDNRGLVDVGQNCTVDGVLTLRQGGVLRLYSSAAAVTGLYGIRGGSTFGGTLDIVTDAGSPPATGAPRDIATNYNYLSSINGTFDAITGGGLSPSLGYAVLYPGGPRHAQLQVTAMSQLSVGSVAAPSSGSVGDDVHVTWTTHVGGATSTPWTESVFLSPSPTVNDASTLLGTLSRTGAVAAGADRAGAIDVRLPAGVPGGQYVVVVADSGLSVPMPDRSITVGSAPITVSASTLAVGGGAAAVTVGATSTRVSGATSAVLDGTRLIELTGAPGDVQVTVDPANAVSLTGAVGRVPTDADHDAVAANGTLLLPAGASGGTRYLRLVNGSNANVAVTVTAVAPGLSIVSATPASVTAGSSVPVAVSVTGTGFTTSSAAQLVCGAQTINAVATQVGGPTGLTSTFNLPTAVGTCDVKVGAAVRPGALTVTAPSVPLNLVDLDPTIRIDLPSSTRSESDNQITVNWTNTTGYSIPAPLITVSAVGGLLRHPGTPGLGSANVEVLGIAPTGPAGVLAPGASGSQVLLLRTDSTDAHATVSVRYNLIDPAGAFDYGAALAAGLGPQVPAAARAWVKANGPSVVGATGVHTTADLERHLGDVATRLSGLGRRIADPARLLGYELGLIEANDRMDAFRNEEFGVGQRGLGLPRAVVDPRQGDVLITDGDRVLRYAKLATGAFEAPPGSEDTLAAVSGGGWSLTARNGARRTFNAAGLLVSATDADLNVLTYGYAAGKVTSVSDPRLGSMTYTYDGAGHVSTSTLGNGEVVTYTYDGGGRMASHSSSNGTTVLTWTTGNQLASTTDITGVVTTYRYDGFGRSTGVSVNGTSLGSVTYNADGSSTTTDAAGRTSTAWIDDTGSLARLVDAEGRVVTVARDAEGRAVGTVADGVLVGERLVTTPQGVVDAIVDGTGGVTDLTYDADGLLAAVSDPGGRTTTVGRDDAMRVTSVTDAAGRTSSVRYDSDGQVAAIVDRTGQAINVSYLDSVFPSRISIPGSGDVDIAYDDDHNVVSATGPTGTTTFTYDDEHQMTGVTYPTGLGLTFTYDAAGRRLSTTTTDGHTYSATYDARGRMATSSADGAIAATYSYDALDRLASTVFANGTRTDLTRDAPGRLTRQRTSKGATTISDVVLSYDANDRIRTRTDATGTTTYTYDAAGKLLSAVTVGASPRTISYTYDGSGNRTGVADSGGATTASTIGPDGRPTQIGVDSVSFDDEGRMTARGTRSYEWTPTSRLSGTTIGGTTTTYTYDALGTPISRTDGSTTTNLLVDPAGLGWLVGEYTDTNSLRSGYLWGQGVTARTDASGIVSRFYATDTRGDVVALTDASGTVTDSYRYLPFGEVAAHTGSTVQPFQFGGGVGMRTAASGLVDVRARIYDPATGRFLSDDPVLFADANPATWASSDPINRADPSGRDGILSDYNNDPLGYAASAFGFNTEGSALANLAQGLGMLSGEAASTTGSIGTALQTRLLEHSQELYREAMSGKYTGPAQKWLTEGSDAMVEAAKTEGRQYASKAKWLGRLGVAAGAYQAAENVYNGWSGDWGNNTALVVRHGSALVLKTILGRFPGADLLVDPVSNVVDQGSLQLYQDYFGVDPTTLYNESGWRPPGKKPRPGGDIPNSRANDPNAIIGPRGATVGTQRFVAATDELPYRVLFENKASASLPAGEVVITNTLDADIDLATFRLGAVGFGGRSWSAPAGARNWSTILDDRDRSGLFVRMRARLDLATRTITWTFTSLDPTTMAEPADATRGFLPRNATKPQGEGFVSYSAHAAAAVTTGTAIAAQASIVFDGNAAIATNVDTVVVDAGMPTATPTVAASSTNPVTVTLGSSDDPGGSGVGLVDVWASKDGAPFALVGDAVTGPTFAYTGAVGSSYRFAVAPDDQVANRGVLSAATSAVLVLPPPTIPPGDPGTPPGDPGTPPSGPGSDPGAGNLGVFTALAPFRALDTRTGTGTSGSVAPVGPGGVLELVVTGAGGVPATGVSAVALNVTAVAPSEDGYLTVWPTGIARPEVSSLNFDAGETIPNAVVVKVGADGKISIFNPFGNTDVIVDVSGFWSTADGPGGAAYTSIAPTRALDTRQAGSGGAVHADSAITLSMAGVAGVPDDATGVVLNVVAADPTATGYLTVWPTGAARPEVSTHNFVAGTTIANLVFARLGDDRSVSIYNASGDTNLIVDVVGYVGAPGGDGGRMVAIDPSRVLDTRQASGGGAPIADGATRPLTVRGLAGVPATATAVVANITAINPTGGGYFTAWASGLAQPLASNLNFAAGDVVPGLSIVGIGADGAIDLFNFGGQTHALVDIVGYIE